MERGPRRQRRRTLLRRAGIAVGVTCVTIAAAWLLSMPAPRPKSPPVMVHRKSEVGPVTLDISMPEDGVRQFDNLVEELGQLRQQNPDAFDRLATQKSVSGQMAVLGGIYRFRDEVQVAVRYRRPPQ
jgi:hypothetical protein